MSVESHAWRGLAAAVLLAACDGSWRPPPAPGAAPRKDEPAPVRVPPPCDDRDGDGFGQGFCSGVDCDDDDPRVTNQCYSCLLPSTGCPCRGGSAPVPCDLPSDGTRGRDGVCHPGRRSCRGGLWSRCEAVGTAERYVGAVSDCEGSCLPGCRHQVDCLEQADPFPSGSVDLAYAVLEPAPFCPVGVRPGGVTVACATVGGVHYTRGVSPLRWLDACGAPGAARLLADADDATSTVALPFAFEYYAAPYGSVGIAANGMVSFVTPSNQYINRALAYPNVSSTLFAFWDDLHLRGGGICAATFGSFPSRRFVVQWDDAYFNDDPGEAHLSFEVVLTETSHTIDVLYERMEGAGSRATGSSATVGIQQGTGSAYDQVGHDTAGLVPSGASLRWSPGGARTVCAPARWVRSWEGSCAGYPGDHVPVWGRFRYTASVPTGTGISFEVRAARTAAELATALPVRLPDAPQGPSTTPVAVDLGPVLRAAMPGAESMDFVRVTATLVPDAGAGVAPVLGSTEIEWVCTPNEYLFECRGGSCNTGVPCRRGYLSCSGTRPVCSDAGPAPVGTWCGPSMVCDDAGACVPCQAGAVCETGTPCRTGRVACTGGTPVCATVAALPVNASCGGGTGVCGPGGACVPCTGVELCDGLDNDCDGRADEDLGTIPCGVGACERSVAACVDGTAGSCTPGLPGPELCDGIDNDCNGSVDEGLSRSCYTGPPGTAGVGTCTAGTQRCVAGLWGACEGAVTPRPESCDGADDDCDGSVDEGYPPSSETCGLGACRRQNPTCSPTRRCTPGDPHPEYCNGVDDDCDGRVDEDLGTVSCGLGACRTTLPACVGGVPVTCVPGPATPELCNGVDDDCDGTTDEGCAAMLQCPATVQTWAGEPTRLAVTATGPVSAVTWTIRTAPAGGAAAAQWQPAPPAQLTETFTAPLVGSYVLEVAATDGRGLRVQCSFGVLVLPRGLRVELTWDGPGNVDLHLHDRSSAPWFTAADTCFSNMSSSWGASLDGDDSDGIGPETIRLDGLVPGESYTVGVHARARAAGRVATVRVYCGSTVPLGSYTSRSFAGSSGGTCNRNDFWKVVRVTVVPGPGCVLTPLDSYTTADDACMRP